MVVLQPVIDQLEKQGVVSRVQHEPLLVPLFFVFKKDTLLTEAKEDPVRSLFIPILGMFFNHQNNIDFQWKMMYFGDLKTAKSNVFY